MEYALHHFSRFSMIFPQRMAPSGARHTSPGTVQIKGSEGSPDQRDPWTHGMENPLGKIGNVMDKKTSDCRCFECFYPHLFAEEKLLTFVNFLFYLMVKGTNRSWFHLHSLLFSSLSHRFMAQIPIPFLFDAPGHHHDHGGASLGPCTWHPNHWPLPTFGCASPAGKQKGWLFRGDLVSGGENLGFR